MLFLTTLLVFIIVCVVAWRLHFFDFNWKTNPKNPVRFSYVVFGLLIYFIGSFLIPRMAIELTYSFFANAYTTQGSLFIIVLVFSLLGYGVLLYKIPPAARSQITTGSNHSVGYQLKSLLFGVVSYLVAFPAALVVSALISMIVSTLFPDYLRQQQVAVTHLQMLGGHRWLLFLTVFSFSIVVPIIEEFLFRGLIQNWLKNVLPRLAAVITTSFLFGAFHFARSQSLDNIELILTLSVLGFFLGYVYEKKGSLLAPIALHATFNLISSLRILAEIFK